LPAGLDRFKHGKVNAMRPTFDSICATGHLHR
jgi:hypothetical protein